MKRRGDADKEGVAELAKVPTPPKRIGLATRAVGLNPMAVTGAGAVNSLPGTGGAPDPSPLRDELIDEMKRHEVAAPEAFLEKPDTGLVQVTAVIPAGARRGDVLDVKVVAPESANINNLAGGWLLESRLRQQMLVNAGPFGGREMKRGKIALLASGGMMTRATYENSKSKGTQTEAVILGGGKVQEDREFGLSLRSDFKHAALASMIESAINERFFFFDGTTRRGIAKATRDDSIQLEAPPRYRNNLPRLFDVIAQIPSNPARRQSQARIQELATQLSDPVTAADAALALEAIGESSTAVLIQALESANPEIRFRAAMTLAYLDQTEAIETLGELIRSEVAFRGPALLALQDMDHPGAVVALEALLGDDSLETCYGALVTLLRRGETNRLPEVIKMRDFEIYVVPQSRVRPTIAASLQDRKMLVCFGDCGKLDLETFLRNNRGYLIRQTMDNTLSIKRFQADDDDFSATSERDIVSFLKGLDRVGASYGDALGVLQLADDRNALSASVAVDPMPKGRRLYFRDDD